MERKMWNTQQALILFMVLALISPSMRLWTMAVQPSDLPNCRTRWDCEPLCKGCGFCACSGGVCVRGCPGPPGQESVNVKKN
ncbi:hypothetical protein Hanom_Chr08g00695621 [Helianthus anomalus]